MAMRTTREIQLAAPPGGGWTGLNDPDVLKACIPGCEELEKTDRTDNHGFCAVAKMKVGPVSARFRCRVTLSDLDPRNGLLSCYVDVRMGGKFVQLGQRLVNTTARKIADQFFANFAWAL
jgi:carbon monoxide dehydrogenase subunit G